MPDHLCLKWSDFHSSIVSALESLKCSEDLVDVTLTCEGQNIKAHKVVLSACSPYFRGVFKENPCQHPVIILKDVLAADMTRLLAYMYQGEVTVLEEHLPALLQTAELLQVSGLTSHSISSPTKQKTPKSTLPLSPNISQKRVVPQAISLLKKPVSSPIVHKEHAHIPVLKTYQPRKKRSSSSEPVDLAAPDIFKKSKITKEKPSIVGTKVVESTSSSLEQAKGESDKDKTSLEENNEQTTSKNNESTGVGSEIKVKQEIDIPECEETEETASEESDPKPFYETSMLARSLISGTHCIKNDSLTSPVIPVSKPSIQVTHEIIPVEIKTESLSPGGGGFEPEILISEEDNRSAANIGNLPANHAAICGDCPHCGTQYSNQSALKYHVRLMHSDLTNRLCCYLCPRSFTVRDTFKEHMWTFHGQRN